MTHVLRPPSVAAVPIRIAPLLLALLVGCSQPPCPPAAAPSPPAEHGHHPAGGRHGAGDHARHGAHGPQGPLVHRFEDPEQYAKMLDRPERDATQKPAEVVRAMAIAEGMTVADVGTGTGYFLPYLSRAVGAGGRVLALDIEPNMIRFVIKRASKEQLANVEPRLVLFEDPLLAPGVADRVLVVNTWHHIPEREAYAKKLWSAVKPGGSVWVVDYTLEAPHGPPKRHRLPPDKVAAELASAGFAPRVDSQLLPDQYIVIATRQP